MRLVTRIVFVICTTIPGWVNGAITWTQTPTGWTWNWSSSLPFNSASGPEHLNNTNAPITITGQYSYTLYNRVWGSSSGLPPWTSPYGTTFDYSESIVRSYSKDLPATKGGRVYDKLLVDEGAQTWSKEAQMETRNKLIYSIVQAEHLETWDLTGGGGGGG